MHRARGRGGRYGDSRGMGGGSRGFRGGRGAGPPRGGGGFPRARGFIRGGRGRGGDSHAHAHPPESGFCLVHHRKRLMSDLMPLEGQPRSFRCRPQKECYQRPESEEVTCHLHNRLRKAHQMKEVRPGVWECLPTSLCRQFGNGPMGVPVVAPAGLGSGARGRDREYYPASRRSRHEGADVASPWAPAAPARTAQGRRAGTGADGGGHGDGDALGGGQFRTRRGAFSERKVWCARHGKHLPASECDAINDCCHVCTDNTLCLSTPLDDASALLERDCRELLCTRHRTLRSVAFLKLNDDRDGYQCVRGHACRGVTLPQMDLADADALDGGVEGGFTGQGEEEDGAGGQDAYFGAGTGGGAGDAYGEAAGHDGVSSFFV